MTGNLRDVLAREAADAEANDVRLDAGETDETPVYSSRGGRGGTSQVYSLRIPAERLAQLRHVADARGEAPTALLRRWVLERLDQEAGAPLSPDELAHLARLPQLAEQIRQVALHSVEDGRAVPRAWVDHVLAAMEKLEAADAVGAPGARAPGT